ELGLCPSVRWVSPDSPVQHTAARPDASAPTSAFVQTVRANQVWNEGPAYLRGQGVTVAVLDSGDCINTLSLIFHACNDLKGSNNQSRVLIDALTNTGVGVLVGHDDYGHGSLVEGVVGGNGQGSNGKYMGIAPGV